MFIFTTFIVKFSGNSGSPAGFNTGLHTLQSINPKLLEQVICFSLSLGDIKGHTFFSKSKYYDLFKLYDSNQGPQNTLYQSVSPAD